MRISPLDLNGPDGPKFYDRMDKNKDWDSGDKKHGMIGGGCLQ